MKCQAAGKDRDQIWEEWCNRNQDRRCRDCDHWKKRETSIYQEEKCRKK